MNIEMKRVFTLIVLSLIISTSFCQEAKDTRIEHFNLKKNVAISGYDPVSYFSKSPKKGSSDYKYVYKGITYHFSNEKNKKSFINHPQKYEPAYGGWCASAMSSNSPHKVGINPQTYKIVNNKLYLFYNKLGINTLNSWNKGDEAEKIKSGNKNWEAITSK